MITLIPSLLGMSFFTNLPGLIPAGVSILFRKMAQRGVNNKQALILDEMCGACDGALLGAIVSLDSRIHEQATYMGLPAFTHLQSGSRTVVVRGGTQENHDQSLAWLQGILHHDITLFDGGVVDHTIL
jgi:hypothetical protein